MTIPVPEDWISLADAADIADRSPITLRWAAAHGRLDAVKIGNSWGTTREALAAYMAYVSARDWLRDPARRPGPRPRARPAVPAVRPRQPP